MKKLSAIIIAALTCAGVLGSCNSDDSDMGEATAMGVAVYNFKLQRNDSVLANLDSVFFSIDLVRQTIFNADSLPYGTQVDKLVPSIVLYESASKIELTVTRENGTDTVYDYMASATDSIDFRRPVALKVTSLDGLYTMDYTITVNVHTQKSDSLVWDRAARRVLPSAFTAPTEQHTTAGSDAVYVLTRAGSEFSIASTADIASDNWKIARAALPSGAITGSFTAAGTELFILADDGGDTNSHALYSSADNGSTWNIRPGVRLTHIYGALNGKIAANRRNADGSWSLVDISDNSARPVPAGMPVTETSNPTTYTTSMATGPQMVIVGGKTSDGTVASSCWAYDGTSWACISANPLPWAGRRMQIVNFVSFRTNNQFITTTYPTLIAFGGLDKDGALQRTVYMSRDYGITWVKAPELMQFPQEIPACYDAQTVVASMMLSDKPEESEVWSPVDLHLRLPGTAIVGGEIPQSRVVRPIEEWECPFIYVFGARNAAGTTSNTIWRATFSRLTYKPLY